MKDYLIGLGNVSEETLGCPGEIEEGDVSFEQPELPLGGCP